MKTAICGFLIIIIIIIINIGLYCNTLYIYHRDIVRCLYTDRDLAAGCAIAVETRNNTHENGNYTPTLSVAFILISNKYIDAGNRYKIVNPGTIKNRYVNVQRHTGKQGIGSG